MASKSNNGSISHSDSNVTSTLPPTPFQIMLRAMANDASAEDSNFGGDDLNVILSAESEDDLFESDERPPLNFQHLSGCELEIVAIDVKFSRGSSSDIVTPFVYRDERGNEKKMYLLVKCFRVSDAGTKKNIIKLPDIGEVFTANTSARFVVAKLWRAQILGLFDADQGITWPCVVQETDLGDEKSVIKLRPMPKRATRSTAE